MRYFFWNLTKISLPADVEFDINMFRIFNLENKHSLIKKTKVFCTVNSRYPY